MKQIKIACISDTHTKHEYLRIPECDILICAGDFTFRGKHDESLDFLEWFDSQTQAKEKVYIAGNHEVMWDSNKTGGKHPGWLEIALKQYSNIHYLEHSSIELFGLKIFGSPYTPEFFPEYWAFNVPRGEEIKTLWKDIPDDINILVTHGPMQGFLDEVPVAPFGSRYPGGHVGCADLMNRVYQLKDLQLMVVGHIHEHTQIIDIPFGDRTFKYVNAAVVDDAYLFKHQAQIINLNGNK